MIRAVCTGVERATRDGPLETSELGLAAVLAIAPFVCVELEKAVFRRAGWTLGPGADR
jgi:hypothetical protein